MRFGLLALFALSFVGCGGQAPMAPTGPTGNITVQVFVQDQRNVTIWGAAVSMSPPIPGLPKFTDDRGVALFTKVPYGEYIVTASADGFVAASKPVSIQTPITSGFSIQLSPLR